MSPATVVVRGLGLALSRLFGQKFVQLRCSFKYCQDKLLFLICYLNGAIKAKLKQQSKSCAHMYLIKLDKDLTPYNFCHFLSVNLIFNSWKLLLIIIRMPRDVKSSALLNILLNTMSQTAKTLHFFRLINIFYLDDLHTLYIYIIYFQI